MIGTLESANVEEDPEARRRLLTFVIAGGGFAGVESIGAMNDFLREAVKYYPRLDPTMVKVILVHHGDVLLPEFDPKLGKYTERKLREAGIDIRLKTGVGKYDGCDVQLDPGEAIPAGTLLWTAGVTPDRLVNELPLKKEKGRIVVDGCMRSVDRPEVWVVGDAAACPDPTDGGKAYPATAQTAIRMGPRLAKNIEAVVLKTGDPVPFKYKMMGQLAAIGQRNGTAQIFGFRFSGFIAWFMWRGDLPVQAAGGREEAPRRHRLGAGPVLHPRPGPDLHPQGHPAGDRVRHPQPARADEQAAPAPGHDDGHDPAANATTASRPAGHTCPRRPPSSDPRPRCRRRNPTMLPLIGEGVDRADGRKKVTGGGPVRGRVPLPGLCHAVLVSATIGKGRITDIDTWPRPSGCRA